MNLKDMGIFSPKAPQVDVEAVEASDRVSEQEERVAQVPINRASLEAVINGKPGMSVSEIGKALRGDDISDKEKSVISTMLWQLMQDGDSTIKRVKLDRYYQYFPLDYKVEDIDRPKLGRPRKAAEALPRTQLPKPSESNLVSLVETELKNYVWETGASSNDLRLFLEWFKNKGNDSQTGETR